MSAPTLSPRPAPTVHATRWLLRRHLVNAAWLVALALAAPFAVLLVGERLWPTEQSIVQWARQVFIWWPFVVALIWLQSLFPVAVAAGVTRRTLARACLSVAVIMGALHAVTLTGALQLERALVGTRGWAQQPIDDTALFDDTSEVGWLLLDLWLVLTASQLCGLLVGIAYQRAGGWWGTLALPLTAGPIFLVVLVLTTPVLDPLPVLARLPVSLGLLTAVALAFVRLVRGAPMGSPSE